MTDPGHLTAARTALRGAHGGVGDVLAPLSGDDRGRLTVRARHIRTVAVTRWTETAAADRRLLGPLAGRFPLLA